MAILSASAVFDLHELGDVLQRRDQHFWSVWIFRDRVGAHRRHDFPAVLSGNFLPALRAVENHFPVRILLEDDACQRLDHQCGVDAVSLELRASDCEIGVDHDDVLAEVDALGGQVHLGNLELRSAHVDGELLALKIGQRLDLVVLGEDDEVGERESGADDADRYAFLVELLQNGRAADQHVGLACGKAGIES